MLRKEIKLSFSYLLLLQRPDNNIAFDHVIETLDGFGDKAHENILAYSKKAGLTLRQACLKILKDGFVTMKCDLTKVEPKKQQKIIKQETIAVGKKRKLPPTTIEGLKAETYESLVKISFNKVQKESLSELFRQIEKHKDHKDTDDLVAYLSNTKCMSFLCNYAEKQERDPTKLMRNIDILLEICQ